MGIQHTDIVPGDIVLLFAGTLIPADGLLLESKDLFVNEALLTGESMAAEKEIGVSPEISSLSERKNSVFMGTSVRSGTGKMLPALAIGTDHVDKDWRKTRHRWNISIVKKIMVHFGLLSSLFDFITFGFLLYFFHASPEAFRTGWFLESLLSELIIIFIVRTFKPFYHSRPSRWLLISSILVAILSIPLPYLWFGHLLGFVPLPFWSILSLLTIAIAYALISEITKRYLFKSIAVRDI